MASLQASILPPHPVLNTLCSPCLCCFLPLRVLAELCLTQRWACLKQKKGSLPPFPSFSFLSCLLTYPEAYFGGGADHRSFLKRPLLRPLAHSHAGKHPRIHLKTTENPNYSPLSVFLINNSIYLVSSLWR